MQKNECQSFTPRALIILGQRDRIVLTKIAVKAKQRFPHARVAILDQCGHAPQLELPSQLFTLVQSH